ncbi:ATP-dependent acyl-CoA ligase [Nocardioides ginsengisoli]|uniref:Class I adenylate-forming enzyme family protein n=1 Tax=Nocardioides ginsengisoli TaxID=363868 RepID=A0ABW3VT66_9ACTN
MTIDQATFEQRWRCAVRDHGRETFLVFRDHDGTVTSWSYGEFERIVASVAATLRSYGVRPGDAVHVGLRNCPAFVAVWLAVSRLGAWMVPVDPASAGRDIARQMARTAPVVAVCPVERLGVYREQVPEIPVIGVEQSAVDVRPGGALTAVPARPVCAGEEQFPPEAAAPGDRLAVMFTSGTTSEPKGVVLSQQNYAHVAGAMADVVNLTTESRWYVTLPLFHANAQYYCFAPAIAVGASVALTASFSASRWLTWASQLDVTHASLFAAPIRMILARRPEVVPRLQLEHVWYAQSLAAGQYDEFAALVGCRPRQLYGMTETIAIASADLSDAPGHDRIGDPADLGRSTRVVDPVSGVPVPAGTPGLLLVGGTRGVDLFVEYLDDPVTTAGAFERADGLDWLRTSDLVVADATGILRFVGRVDDVIKVAGENVSLTEVEAALGQAPGVLEAAVLAEEDPVRDVVPVAFVVPRDPTRPPTVDGLAAWAADHLAPQARPRRWTLVDALPRTSVGKIRRQKLKEAFAATVEAADS